MELRQLEYFRETGRRGSVTAAALALNVSQPSVTTGIRRLEEELGVLLFDRINRRLTLTRAGRDFLGDAETILAMVNDAGTKMRDYQAEPRGVVRLGITPVMSVTLLPPVVAHYQREHPQVDIHVVEQGSLSIATHLERGELDLGILVLHDTSSTLDRVTIGRREIRVCLPPGHELARFDAISFAALRGQPFILFEEDTYSRRLIMEECRRSGFEPRIVFVSSQIGTVAGLVREGMGVAFFLEDIAATLGDVVIRPLTPRLELEAGVVWNSERYLSSASRHLIDALAGEAG